jgi:predicted DNA-binding ribbon-helix-helix protein
MRPNQKTSLVNRNIFTATGRSSMRLEPELWSALRDIGRIEGVPPDDLIQHAARAVVTGSRTSAVRVFVLQYFRQAVADFGLPPVGLGDQIAEEQATARAEKAARLVQSQMAARPMVSWRPGMKPPADAEGMAR